MSKKKETVVAEDATGIHNAEEQHMTDVVTERPNDGSDSDDAGSGSQVPEVPDALEIDDFEDEENFDGEDDSDKECITAEIDLQDFTSFQIPEKNFIKLFPYEKKVCVTFVGSSGHRAYISFLRQFVKGGFIKLPKKGKKIIIYVTDNANGVKMRHVFRLNGCKIDQCEDCGYGDSGMFSLYTAKITFKYKRIKID